ncbi:Xylose isomerase-like TIM barrel [Geobacillus sp. BCO2]|nr:Xylose isomerase-like TIM barrel [Geobacillus sp. BCO2]
MGGIVIPLNAFEARKVKEKGQCFFVQKLRGMGVWGVEIRRELLTQHDYPLARLKKVAEQEGVVLVYSSPSPLWTENGQLNQELDLVIKEAEMLGAIFIKVPLGHYDPFVSKISDLAFWVEKINEPAQLLIENDQTFHGGTIGSLHRFFRDVRECRLPVYMTFDIGNWKCCGENLMDALSHFHSFVRYIHLKHVERHKGEWRTVPLTQENAKEWKNILSVFPSNLPIALEFPINGVESIPYYVRLLQAT